MTIDGIGNDIIEVQRISDAIKRLGPRFLDKIFTLREQTYCLSHKESSPYFAGRFAAKEAIVKALGIGFREGIRWTDIEIINDSLGKPCVFLSPSLFKRFPDTKLLVTISHCKDYASAVALRMQHLPI